MNRMNRMKLPLLLVKSGFISVFVGVTLFAFFGPSLTYRPRSIERTLLYALQGTSILLFAGGCLLLIAAGVAYVRARKKIAAMLHTSAGMLCPRCEYNLRGLPSDGDCPECGTHYTHEALQRAWRGMK